MKITSYKTGAGRRARPKDHKPDVEEGGIGIGYQREGISGRRIPGAVVTLHFDGRTMMIELDEAEAKSLKEKLVHL